MRMLIAIALAARAAGADGGDHRTAHTAIGAAILGNISQRPWRADAARTLGLASRALV